jgi:hypothetical protein
MAEGELYNNKYVTSKLHVSMLNKLSLLEPEGTHKFVVRQAAHIFLKIGTQMAVSVETLLVSLPLTARRFLVLISNI